MNEETLRIAMTPKGTSEGRYVMVFSVNSSVVTPVYLPPNEMHALLAQNNLIRRQFSYMKRRETCSEE
jgi:hypothetical protein